MMTVIGDSSTAMNVLKFYRYCIHYYEILLVIFEAVLIYFDWQRVSSREVISALRLYIQRKKIIRNDEDLIYF